MTPHETPATTPYIFDQDPTSLRTCFSQWQWPAYRADQVLEWVYGHGVCDPAAMTNLPRDLRDALAQRVRWTSGTVHTAQEADDGVKKLLIAWHPATVRRPRNETSRPQTECVMIPAEDRGRLRRTACVSSQVGCAVGCRFCASGLSGLDADLSAGQILEQVWHLNRQGDERVTHVVFMGMGEPLANYEQVVKAVRMLTAPWSFSLSARRITISTVGLPAQMRRLADEDLPVTLALSLHAPTDELRRQLIPWSQYVSIDQLLAAAQDYFHKTGREVTLEYTLMRDVNDRPEHAEALARLARVLRCHINLIRYNEVRGLPFARPATDNVHQFQAILRQASINTHIRASRGRNIAAACGQLRTEVGNPS